MGCHFLLQGIILTQGSNLGSPHCRQILYHLSHQGSPKGKSVTHEGKKGDAGEDMLLQAPAELAVRSSSCYANILAPSSASCSLLCHLVAQLYLTLYDTINCSSPLTTRLLHQRVFPGKNTGVGFISFSWGSSWPRCWTCIISSTGRQTPHHWATKEALPPGPAQSQLPTLGIRRWSDWLHLIIESIRKSCVSSWGTET